MTAFFIGLVVGWIFRSIIRINTSIKVHRGNDSGLMYNVRSQQYF